MVGGLCGCELGFEIAGVAAVGAGVVVEALGLVVVTGCFGGVGAAVEAGGKFACVGGFGGEFVCVHGANVTAPRLDVNHGAVRICD